ncbi:E3 ubiquitin-protein ligase SIRP1-like isoform X1 [Oryza brachyantha]|nr:E3 ubiquitin-protein ligase SIRP1-like isoform X1 [Oryza brachyantha]XP_040382111.1 E3 ubiquitin-protein ligase SIRP1-like isoform X1 [Oryza brachyantha]
MAEEAAAAGGWYWCHMCASAVSAVAAAEGEAEIKCPYCQSGFLEEMETARGAAAVDGGGSADGTDSGAGSAISVWAPVIDGMVGGDPVRRRRSRRHADASTGGGYHRELDHLVHFDFSERRRRTAALLLLLQEFRERQLQRLESAAAAAAAASSAGSGGGGSLDGEGMALADYFLGPGLDALMQRLGDGDAGRQGTLPAKKEAIDAMPTVEVTAPGDDSAAASACAVCLEDYAVGERAMEMPCRHRFHGKCIVPWLEMHSSCPVCRFQLPTDDDPKAACGGSGDHAGAVISYTNAEDSADAGANASRLPAAIQRLSSLFSSQPQPGPSPSPSSSSAAPASTSGTSSQHSDD